MFSLPGCFWVGFVTQKQFPPLEYANPVKLTQTGSIQARKYPGCIYERSFMNAAKVAPATLGWLLVPFFLRLLCFIVVL